MFKLSRIVKEWRESGSLQAHINVSGLWDEETFLTKSGDLAIVLRVKGIDYESLDSTGRDHAVKRLEAALRAFDPRVRVYQVLFKANQPAIAHAPYENPLVKQAVEQRMAYFAASRRLPRWIISLCCISSLFYSAVMPGDHNRRQRTETSPAIR